MARIKNVKRRLVAQAFGAFDKVSFQTRPTRVHRERFNIFHDKCNRLDALNNLEKIPHMLGARVIWVHFPGDREALAWRSTNNNVCRARSRNPVDTGNISYRDTMAIQLEMRMLF
ncbi:hypothetical protein GCM10009590_02270 [Brachybacterium alimentarium]